MTPPGMYIMSKDKFLVLMLRNEKKKWYKHRNKKPAKYTGE